MSHFYKFLPVNLFLIAIACALLYDMISNICHTTIFIDRKETIKNTAQIQNILTNHQSFALQNIDLIHFPLIYTKLFLSEEYSLNSTLTDDFPFCFSTSGMETTNIAKPKEVFHFANQKTQQRIISTLHESITSFTILTTFQFEMHPVLLSKSSSNFKTKSSKYYRMIQDNIQGTRPSKCAGS